ncbi:MAG TPA: hypothetical protein VMV94_10635 [Phycisphaerae bacterium]|nr:hypothetical protein [Phycisphaerae bacterium]
MSRPAPTIRPFPDAAQRLRRGALAFTVIELLVSMAVLIVAILALATVFDLSSETTGRTVAHAEAMEESAAVQQRFTDLLSKIEPGLLIIESPPPTLARSEIPEGDRLFRQRRDCLVFVAMGPPGAFQSFTDPTRWTPALPTEPASSREALIYLGPGIPLTDSVPPKERPFDDDVLRIPAVEWVFAHRAILLLADDPGHVGWAPPNMNVIVNGLLGGGTLLSAAPTIRQGQMDAVVSSTAYRADGLTIIDEINRKPASDLVSATPTFAGLWDANVTPTSASLDPNALDHYPRSGFTLQPRLADFRIEWTDGRDNLGAPDYGTRWFGLRPNYAEPVPVDATGHIVADQIQYRAQCRHHAPYVADATPDERAAFETKIECSSPGDSGGPDVNERYRAVWRADTWQYRPKALRFTYRIYDAQNRLKQLASADLNEDGVADTNPIARWGQEFSIVVPIP